MAILQYVVYFIFHLLTVTGQFTVRYSTPLQYQLVTDKQIGRNEKGSHDTKGKLSGIFLLDPT